MGFRPRRGLTPISRDGTIAAGWAFVPRDTRVEAGYWDLSGQAHPLGGLPGYFDSVVTSMNGDGTILAGQHSFGSNVTSAIWTQPTGWRTMATIAAELGFSLPQGWIFEEVRAISADGSTYAGSVMNETRTQRHGLVLQVPAPSCLLALPMLFAVRRRRRIT